MNFVRFGILKGPVVYLAQVVGQNTHRRTWRQAAQIYTLCQFSVRHGHVLYNGVLQLVLSCYPSYFLS